MQADNSTSGNHAQGEPAPDPWAERLETLLQGRFVVPWGRSVGLSTGTTHRLSEGKFPDPEKLVLAMRVERLSLSWLVDNQGAPFLVSTTHTDKETADLLACTLGDEPDQTTTLVCTAHGQPRVAVLTQPAQFLLKESWIDYTAVQVIAGPIGTESIAAIARHAHGTVRRLVMPEDDLKQLATGRTGNVALVGWSAQPGGVLDTATPIPIKKYRAVPPQEHYVAEPAIPYQLHPTHGTDTHEALAILDSLDPTTRTTVLTMLRALAPPNR